MDYIEKHARYFIYLGFLLAFYGSVTNKHLISNVGFIGACVLIYYQYKHWSPSAREKARRSTRVEFTDGITVEQFKGICADASRRFSKLESATGNSFGQVTLRWYSTTGKTYYEIVMDFNDYGHLTGRYWILDGRKLIGELGGGSIFETKRYHNDRYRGEEGPVNDLIARVGSYIAKRIREKSTAVPSSQP